MKNPMSKEPINKKMGLDTGKPSMQLPRSDDGKVHTATGERSPQSAANFADAMTGFGADSPGKAMRQDSGR